MGFLIEKKKSPQVRKDSGKLKLKGPLLRKTTVQHHLQEEAKFFKLLVSSSGILFLNNKLSHPAKTFSKVKVLNQKPI